MRRKSRKLEISKETVRNLNEIALNGIGGAVVRMTVHYTCTVQCPLQPPPPPDDN